MYEEMPYGQHFILWSWFTPALFKIGNVILNKNDKLDTQVILHNSFVEQIGISSCMIRLTILDDPCVGKIDVSKLPDQITFYGAWLFADLILVMFLLF